MQLKFSLAVAMATIQNQRFCKIHKVDTGYDTNLTADFHFFYQKSMGILNCHSNMNIDNNSKTKNIYRET